MSPASGINNPTVPGHAFMPAPAKSRAPRSQRGRVVKVPKSLTEPKVKMPRQQKPRAMKDSMRLRVPKAKVIK